MKLMTIEEVNNQFKAKLEKEGNQSNTRTLASGPSTSSARANNKEKTENATGQKKEIGFSGALGIIFAAVVMEKVVVPVAKESWPKVKENLPKCFDAAIILATTLQSLVKPSTPALPAPSRVPIIDTTATTVSKPQSSASTVPAVSQASNPEVLAMATVTPTPQKAVYEKEFVNTFQDVHVALDIGWRGSGKTTFGFKGLEYCHDRGMACYAYGIPQDKRSHLPDWVGHIDKLEDLPNGAALLIDEASLTCFYREQGSDAAKKFALFISLARQKKQVIIIVSQLSSEVHINLVRMVDVIFVKDPGVLSFERNEFRVPLEGAKKAFSGLNEADRQAHVFAYNGRTGAILFFKTDRPTFWKPEISCLFDGVNIAESGIAGAPSPQAQAPSSEEIAQKVRDYHKANPNVSRWELARIFKVSIGSVYNYLDDYPYKKKGRPVSSTPKSTTVST